VIAASVALYFIWLFVFAGLNRKAIQTRLVDKSLRCDANAGDRVKRECGRDDNRLEQLLGNETSPLVGGGIKKARQVMMPAGPDITSPESPALCAQPATAGL
jgi:hypothetical protein